MSNRTRSRRAKACREFATPYGSLTTPPGSPKIMIHTRQGRCVGIHCDQPAKVLCVETQVASPPARSSRRTWRCCR
jgi:hypothetical protein